MKYNHYIVRTIKKNTRSDEYKTSGRYLDSTLLFNRLSERMSTPEADITAFKVKQSYGTGKLIQRKSLAEKKVFGVTYGNWAEKRGKIVDTMSAAQTAKVVFEMLDTQQKGKITGNLFCEFLVDIGMPIECKALQKLVLRLKNVKSIEQVNLEPEDISSLCREDHRTYKCLAALNSGIEELRRGSTNMILLFNVLKSWWEEAEGSKFNNVHCNDICNIIVRKGMACDFGEAHKLVISYSFEGYFDFEAYQLIFGKPLILQLLRTIQDKFSIEDWENADFSHTYKLSQLKRHLILAGIHYPVPKISLEEGLSTLQAIEKYAKFKNKEINKMTYDEFCELWLGLTGEKIGSKAFKPDSKELDARLAGLPEKLTMKVKNNYTVLGNLDIKRSLNKKWSHSLSVENKKNRHPVSYQELRCLKQNNALKDFISLVNHSS